VDDSAVGDSEMNGEDGGEDVRVEETAESSETQDRKCLGLSSVCPLCSVFCGLSESMWLQIQPDWVWLCFENLMGTQKKAVGLLFEGLVTSGKTTQLSGERHVVTVAAQFAEEIFPLQ